MCKLANCAAGQRQMRLAQIVRLANVIIVGVWLFLFAAAPAASKIMPHPKLALPAIGSIEITVTASQLSPQGQTAVTVTVRDTVGQPQPGVPVSLFAPWGSITPPAGVTDTTGRLSATFTAGKQPGQVNITALAGYAAASTVIEITGTQNNQPPNAPTLLAPANGIANLPLTYTLSLNWLASDPDNDLLVYQVALGETNPPPIVANSVMASSYTPSFEPQAKTYYWSITASDGAANQSSSIWSLSYAPAASPPDGPYSPQPPHNATDVSLDTTLTWRNSLTGTSPFTYTISFGATMPPPVVATQNITGYPLTGLISNTTYYWMITATNGISLDASPIWQFTTLSPGGDNLKLFLPTVIKD